MTTSDGSKSICSVVTAELLLAAYINSNATCSDMESLVVLILLALFKSGFRKIELLNKKIVGNI
jgi:hypothetical protein